MPDPTHAHSMIPGTDAISAPLVLLHGSGGNEFDLVSLADELAPERTKLAIRGTVPIDGGFAFFRRFPDRRVDEVDIADRAPLLAQFIENASERDGSGKRPIAIGFSNGAIMAAALLLTNPALFAAAVLFRPLSPFTHDVPHRMDGTPVLIIEGDDDDRRSRGDGLKLAERLVRAGAQVTHHALPVGHAVTVEDRRIAREWLQRIGASL